MSLIEAWQLLKIKIIKIMSLLGQTKDIKNTLSKTDLQSMLEEMVREINLSGGVIGRTTRVIDQFNTKLSDNDNNIIPLQIQIDVLIDEHDFIEMGGE